MALLCRFLACSRFSAVGAYFVAYALKTGGVAYYLPSFFRIIAWGFRISAIAAILAVAGVWRKSPLRWHAMFCALAMLFYWSTAVFE